MSKRGLNIYKRKDNRYEGRYIKGRREDGKAIYGYIYSRLYSVCKERLLQAKRLYINVNMLPVLCGEGLFTDFMYYWLHQIASVKVKPSTMGNYTTIVEKWIIPFFGEIQMSKVARHNVQEFVNMLISKGLAPGTIRNIYRVLDSALKFAVENSYMHVNPCNCIALPPVRQKEARHLSLGEQKVLETVASSYRYSFSVELALYTGMRVGEICALKWSDVDFTNGVIHVSQTIQRVRQLSPKLPNKTTLLEGSVKSDASVRVIPIPGNIYGQLVEMKENATCEYVFSYKKHHLEPRMLQYQFKVMLKKAGLNDYNFHALRHTFATRCMELNFDVKTLSEILGHASAKMTLDKYGHSQFSHKKALMDDLAHKIGNIA